MADEPIFARIWRTVTRVPRGRVATYGRIALMTGLHRGARTVGWALRALPDDGRIDGVVVPWHRVINARGTISDRGGPGDGGIRRQAAALRREGVMVSADGRISLGHYLWRGERRSS